LTETFASRPNTTVVAAVRDPAAQSSKELEVFGQSLKNGSKIIIVKVSATSETEAKEAVSRLQNEHGIDHLDVVSLDLSWFCRGPC
jgi:norsolorinic acid ketoreductase